MKIDSVAVEILEVPVAEGYVAAGRAVDANWHVLARVRTTDGVEGIGYVVKQRGELVRAIAQATRELADHMPGMNVLEPDAVWQSLSARTDWVGPGGLQHWAIAPLDIALWDAAGKVLGQPLYRLLGGCRDHLTAYASDRLWYSLSLDDLAASARAHADAGYKGIKLRLSASPDAAMQCERVRVAAEGAGAGVDVMVDGTQSWDYPTAARLGPALQDAGVTWLEDPVYHADVAGFAALAERLDIPVTGGENLYTLAQFRETFEARAVDIAILDLFRVGGITPWRKIAALAEAYRLPVCGHVVPEVHVHLLAAVPNGHMVEFMPRSTEILANMPTPQDGILRPADGPGHGLVLDEKTVARCRVD
ncbi:MAG: mandelate racemase/muconate lactonizing enzyme family protein [Gammaproteobacteria bacterium]|jgi:L-alanine-DL-glutamate epimerase-like enolase superfamily enzyme